MYICLKSSLKKPKIKAIIEDFPIYKTMML